MLDALGELRNKVIDAIYNDALSFQGVVYEFKTKFFGIPVRYEYHIYLDKDTRVIVSSGLLSMCRVDVSTRMYYDWLTTKLKLPFWKRVRLARHAIACHDKHAQAIKAKRPQGHQLSHMEKKLCERYNIPFE